MVILWLFTTGREALTKSSKISVSNPFLHSMNRFESRTGEQRHHSARPGPRPAVTTTAVGALHVQDLTTEAFPSWPTGPVLIRRACPGTRLGDGPRIEPETGNASCLSCRRTDAGGMQGAPEAAACREFLPDTVPYSQGENDRLAFAESWGSCQMSCLLFASIQRFGESASRAGHPESCQIMMASGGFGFS